MNRKLWLLLCIATANSVPAFSQQKNEKTLFIPYQAAGPVGYINANAVRLRETPSLNGKVISLLSLGSPVRLLRKSTHTDSAEWKRAHWHEVMLHWRTYNPSMEDSVKGWVFGAFVELGGDFNFVSWAENQTVKYEMPALYQTLISQKWVERKFLWDGEGGGGSFDFHTNVIAQHGYEYYGLIGVVNVKQTGPLSLEISAYQTGQRGMGDPQIIFPCDPQYLPYSVVKNPGKIFIDIYPGWDSVRIRFSKNNELYFAGNGDESGGVFFAEKWTWSKVVKSEVPQFNIWTSNFAGTYLEEGEPVIKSSISGISYYSNTVQNLMFHWPAKPAIVLSGNQDSREPARMSVVNAEALAPMNLDEVLVWMGNHFSLPPSIALFEGGRYLHHHDQTTDTLWVKPKWIEIHYADGRQRIMQMKPVDAYQPFLVFPALGLLIDPLYPNQVLYENLMEERIEFSASEEKIVLTYWDEFLNRQEFVLSPP